MKSLVVIAVICSLFYSSVDGLKCYECAYAEARTANNGTVRAPLLNSKCFSDWDQVPLNECSPLEKYCQIIIAEGGNSSIWIFLNFALQVSVNLTCNFYLPSSYNTKYNKNNWTWLFLSGGARTITRSCIVKPLFDDGTTDVAGVKTSYSSCQEDACNAATSLSSGTSMAITITMRIFRPKCPYSRVIFIDTLIKIEI